MSATVIDFRCARVGDSQTLQQESVSGAGHNLLPDREHASLSAAEQAASQRACPVMRLSELMAIAYSAESWD